MTKLLCAFDFVQCQHTNRCYEMLLLLILLAISRSNCFWLSAGMHERTIIKLVRLDTSKDLSLYNPLSGGNMCVYVGEGVTKSYPTLMRS